MHYIEIQTPQRLFTLHVTDDKKLEEMINRLKYVMSTPGHWFHEAVNEYEDIVLPSALLSMSSFIVYKNG